MTVILLDENLPFDLIELFQQFDFTVYHIKKLGKTDIKNGEVYKLSVELSAWIITRDTDFENILKFEQHHVQGIIVLKTQVSLVSYQINLFKSLLDKKVITFSERQLIVIDDNGITIKTGNNA